MCVIAWAWKAHAHCPLVVLANRDERHARATAPLEWWKDAPQILAGRDLEAGGTWLGVSRAGRFAALTNRNSHKPSAAPSRGNLVSSFLRQRTNFADQTADLGAHAADFAGFNLLVSDAHELASLSNREAPQALHAGIHGMANGALDEPIPKVARLKDALSGWSRRGDEPPLEDWLALLADPAPAENNQPRSAIFVRDDVYGTRSSSIIVFRAQGHVLFLERSFDAAGCALDTRQFEFVTTP